MGITFNPDSVEEFSRDMEDAKNRALGTLLSLFVDEEESREDRIARELPEQLLVEDGRAKDADEIPPYDEASHGSKAMTSKNPDFEPNIDADASNG